jgi:hypothetical protein
MKLYELNRGDNFKLTEEPSIPPDALEGTAETKYKLNNIDGMYSHCRDEQNNVYHFAAWTEVEKV